MPDVIVEVFTPLGIKVGKFINPKIEMVPEHNYIISGQFFEVNGESVDKIQFNPEVLPYTADISGATKCVHNRIVQVYVQRARQPVQMMGVCEQA